MKKIVGIILFLSFKIQRFTNCIVNFKENIKPFNYLIVIDNDL